MNNLLRYVSLWALLSSLILPAALPVYAKEATLMAEDPITEERMQDLAANLRCLVCQNESLAGSRSDFANDLRREMRIMINEGKTNDQIIEFMVQRYGDFILFDPPMKTTTMLLWFGPLILFLIAAGVLIVTLMRRRSQIVDIPLTDEEHSRVESLLNTDNKENRT